MGTLIGLGHAAGGCGSLTSAGNEVVLGPTIPLAVSQDLGSQGSLGPGADPFGFVLGDHRQYADSQSVGIRHVYGDKLNTSVA